MLATSWPGSCTRSKAPRTLHLQRGGLQLARSSLSLGDTCSLDVALRIAISARVRGIPHASQCTLLTHRSRREVRADDITRTQTLRSLPCRPRDLLRASRACRSRTPLAPPARGASHTCSHGDPFFPKSSDIRLHFIRPRGRLGPNAERFRARFPPCRRAREGRS